MRFVLGLIIGVLTGYGAFGHTLYLNLGKYDPTVPQYLLIEPAEEAFCFDLSKVMGTPQCVDIRNFRHWLNVAGYAVYLTCSLVKDPSGKFSAEELKAACQFG